MLSFASLILVGLAPPTPAVAALVPPPPPGLDTGADAQTQDTAPPDQGGDASGSEDVEDDEDRARPRAERSQGRVQLEYTGNAYAPQVPWQSAFALSAAWQSRLGVYVGAGYDFTAPYQVSLRSEDAGIALTPRVSRFPISAILGYHWSRGKLGVDGELRVISAVNRVVATTFGLGMVDAGTKGIDQIEDLSFGLGFSPRARVHYRPIPQLSLQLGLGVDLFALNRSYFVQLTDPDTGQSLGKETYLRPRVARPTVGVGFVLWL